MDGFEQGNSMERFDTLDKCKDELGNLFPSDLDPSIKNQFLPDDVSDLKVHVVGDGDLLFCMEMKGMEGDTPLDVVVFENASTHTTFFARQLPSGKVALLNCGSNLAEHTYTPEDDTTLEMIYSSALEGVKGSAEQSGIQLVELEVTQ